MSDRSFSDASRSTCDLTIRFCEYLWYVSVFVILRPSVDKDET